MPRKAAPTTDGSEPRRSSRIKDLPKPEPPKKAPAKPRAKKADGEAPKRGKKRAAEETNGTEPAAKKVRSFTRHLRLSKLAIGAIRDDGVADGIIWVPYHSFVVFAGKGSGEAHIEGCCQTLVQGIC